MNRILTKTPTVCVAKRQHRQKQQLIKTHNNGKQQKYNELELE